MLVTRSSLLVADRIFWWPYHSFQQQVILMYFCVSLILRFCHSSILNNVFVYIFLKSTEVQFLPPLSGQHKDPESEQALEVMLCRHEG